METNKPQQAPGLYGPGGKETNMKATNQRQQFIRVLPQAALLAVIALLAAGSSVSAAGRNPNSGIAPANSKPYGLSYGEWGGAWWRWAYSFPADMNPVSDPTGELAGLGQSGPVWFLAGNFGG